MMTFKDKVVVVTGAGAAKGIGYAVCTMMQSLGGTVCALDIKFDDGHHAAWDTHVCNVSDKAQCADVFAAIEVTHGKIDVLVNCAGIVAATRVADISLAEFEKMLSINLVGIFNVTQASLPGLKKAGGAIVNIASIAAQRGGGLLGGSHYAASKGGVVSFSKACARELGVFGIRVNSINPGIIATDMTAGHYPQERLDVLLPQIPLGRLGKAEEVAKVVAFLASDYASYMTGTEVDVNGGYHIH